MKNDFLSESLEITFSILKMTPWFRFTEGALIYPSGAPEITPSFWWGFCCSVVSFLGCFLCTIIFLFAFFIFSHDVVRFISIYVFDCSSGIFRLSFMWIVVILWRWPYLTIMYLSFFEIVNIIAKKKSFNMSRLGKKFSHIILLFVIVCSYNTVIVTTVTLTIYWKI